MAITPQSAKDHVVGAYKVYLGLAAALALVGGAIQFDIRWPADAKAEAAQVSADAAMDYAVNVEVQLAANLVEQESLYKTRGIERDSDELTKIDHEMDYIEYQIDQINEIKSRWNQELSEREKWKLDQLKIEWEMKQTRRNELTGQ